MITIPSDGKAFIVGNGPSTTAERLDQLIGKFTFGMNRIALMFPKTEWRPTCYIGTTSAVWDDRHKADILAAVDAAESAYCWDAWSINKKGIVYCPCSEINHVDYNDVTDEIWSDDPTVRLSKFGVTAFPAMQVAAYMGFKTICLIGCDGGYSRPQNGKDASHFDAGYRPFDAYANYDYEELNNALHTAHAIAERNCVRLGVKIYNLSPTSTVKAHEFMPFEDAL